MVKNHTFVLFKIILDPSLTLFSLTKGSKKLKSSKGWSSSPTTITVILIRFKQNIYHLYGLVISQMDISQETTTEKCI